MTDARKMCVCEIRKERNDLGKTDANSRTLNGYYLNNFNP